MDPADLGVVLDSSIVIEAKRQRLDVARFVRYVLGQLGERQAALCAISVAELAHGIPCADSAARRELRRAFLDDLKAAIPVYPITAETGELIGKIPADSAQKGIIVPFDDLLIATCALERGYAVATRNERHFLPANSGTESFAGLSNGRDFSLMGDVRAGQV